MLSYNSETGAEITTKNPYIHTPKRTIATPRRKRNLNLNWFFILILTLAFTPWLFGNVQVFNFNITGWAWVIALVVSVAALLLTPKKVSFPIWQWLPWVTVVGVYLIFTARRADAIQTGLQMLCPLAVGCVASIFRPNVEQMDDVVHGLDRMIWVIWALLVVRIPGISIGVFPGHGTMAPEAIGSLLLTSTYAAFYACGRKRHIWFYAAMVAVPVLCLTRGPISAALACLPLTPAPLKKKTRVGLCCILLTGAIVLFYTPRIQSMMFFSGQGTLQDLRWDDPNFRTSGRSAMWDILWEGVEERPFLGHGLNESRTALQQGGFILYLPHNDWLKLLYEVGIVGTACFLMSLLWQTNRLRLIGRNSRGSLRMLAYATSGAFVPFALTMITDNTTLYVQFFGNLHFCLIGFVYGHLRFLKTQGVSGRP